MNSHVIVHFGSFFYFLQVIEAVFEDLALKHKIIQVISLWCCDGGGAAAAADDDDDDDDDDGDRNHVQCNRISEATVTQPPRPSNLS